MVCDKEYIKMVGVLSWIGSHIFGWNRLENLILSVKLICIHVYTYNRFLAESIINLQLHKCIFNKALEYIVFSCIKILNQKQNHLLEG